MDASDVVDDVNALLKLGVGDSYRLEHIKQAYIQNKTIWITDNNYLQQMKEKYLTKHHTDEEINENTDEDYQNREMVHCWKCGKKGPLGANFCMGCGSAIFDVGSKPRKIEEPEPPVHSKSKSRSIGLKIPIIIIIPIIILAILGGGYSQGYFDDVLEKKTTKKIVEDVEPEDATPVTTTPIADNPTETSSKCGPGTILRDNACVLDDRCGPGTIYDEATNSCILDN